MSNNQPIVQFMKAQPRWRISALAPLLYGLFWLLAGQGHSVWIGLPGLILGVIFIAIGMTQLLWPGERQVTHYWAFFSPIGFVLGLLLGWNFGLWGDLFVILGAPVNFLAAGYAALSQTKLPAELPTPEITPVTMLKTALDELLLAHFIMRAHVPRGHEAEKDQRGLALLKKVSEKNGWLEHPERLLPEPQTPNDVQTRSVTTKHHRFELISFTSQYQPALNLAGSEAWLSYQSNKTAYARVFRHQGANRPWLICLHGYQMGTPATDFTLFKIKHLHETLGLNILMPILPLHGQRKAGWISGGHYLDGPLPELFHALCQSQMDIRSAIAWLRHSENNPKMGVLGYSLGGYHAALLACLEPQLDCLIAGIPLVDMGKILWRHIPRLDRRFLESIGLSAPKLTDILAPVSPLHHQPMLGKDKRFIFAATGDQVVPPEQALRLWQHWDRPQAYWYQGSHLSARWEQTTHDFIDDALEQTGFLSIKTEA